MELTVQIETYTVLFCNNESILNLLDTDYINDFNFQNKNKDKHLCIVHNYGKQFVTSVL